MTTRRERLLAAGALAVLVSSFVHFYLYFRAGYRGITGHELLGLSISRSFALNAIGGLIIAELLVLALRAPRLERVAAASGILFCASALVAYGLSRTVGLLGFTEDQTSAEAVIAVVAELVGLGALSVRVTALGLLPHGAASQPLAGRL